MSECVTVRKVSGKGMRIHMMIHVEVSRIMYEKLVEFGKLPMELSALELAIGFRQ